MKLKSNEHICKWFDTYLRHNKRRCKYCSKVQYNYNNVWEDELTLDRFLDKWVSGMGNGQNDVVISVAHPFEFASYESWDRVYEVEFLVKPLNELQLRRATNWNDVDSQISKGLDKLGNCYTNALSFYKECKKGTKGCPIFHKD